MCEALVVALRPSNHCVLRVLRTDSLRAAASRRLITERSGRSGVVAEHQQDRLSRVETPRPEEPSSPAVPQDLSGSAGLQSRTSNPTPESAAASPTRLLVAGRALGHSSSNACARASAAALQTTRSGAALPQRHPGMTDRGSFSSYTSASTTTTATQPGPCQFRRNRSKSFDNELEEFPPAWARAKWPGKHPRPLKPYLPGFLRGEIIRHVQEVDLGEFYYKKQDGSVRSSPYECLVNVGRTTAKSTD